MSKRSLFMSAVCCMFISFPLLAQPQAGQVGIAASVQDQQLDFTVPIWAADRFVVAPSLGFRGVSGQATDFDVALALRLYLAKQKLSPYIGLRGGIFLYSPSTGNNVTDGLFGMFFGGEYFLDQHFSVAGELQVNVAFSGRYSNRFGNPNGTVISSATALHAAFYF